MSGGGLPAWHPASGYGARAIDTDTEAATRDAELVLDFFATVLSGARDTGAVARFLAEDFVDHTRTALPAAPASPPSSTPSGRPAPYYRPTQVIAAAGHVVVRSRLAGGERAVPFSDTYRVDGEKITEHWHVVGA